MEILLEPLQYEFFRYGLFAALLIGMLCGMIGVFIVLKRMSYVGHGLSHAVFGGAVISYVLKFNFYIGSVLWGFLTVILINFIGKKKKIKADAAIGIVTTASFALGVALMSRVRTFTRSFDAALFGNILGVTNFDLGVIMTVTLISFSVIFFMYKQLLFTTFDRETAKIFGINPDRVELIFSLILALAVIASMNIVGVTMIAAVLVIPAVTARMLTDSFGKMLIISTGFGAFAAVIGMYLSYYLNLASGATIVLFAAFCFVLVLIYNYIHERFFSHAHFHWHGEVRHRHEHGHQSVHLHDHKED